MSELRNDGGMLYATHSGHEQRGMSLVQCGVTCPGRHASQPIGSLADYLGVGTAVLEADALDDYGRGWSPPLRWREVKPEHQPLDENALKRAIEIAKEMGGPMLLVQAAEKWLASRPEPGFRRVKFQRRTVTPGDDREAIIPLNPILSAATDALRRHFAERDAELPHVIETLRGATSGRRNSEAIEVNVGWLRELCDAAEPARVCGRQVETFATGGKMVLRTCGLPRGHSFWCSPFPERTP